MKKQIQKLLKVGWIKLKIVFGFSLILTISNIVLAQNDTTQINLKRTPTTPTLQSSPASIFVGGSSSLLASNCTGTIIWSDNQTGFSRTVNPTITTTYQAKCRKDGCDSPLADIVVSVSIAPPRILDGNNNPNNTTICSGQTVTLTASGCNSTVKWGDNQQTRSIQVSPTTTTTYQAVCIEANQTSIASNFVVFVNPSPNKPQIESVPPQKNTLQLGQSFTLSGSCSTGTILWSTGATSNQITVKPTVPWTNYVAYCIDKGCISGNTDYALIALPPTPLLTVSATMVCAGSTVTLKASGCDNGSTYLWNTGDNTQIINVKLSETSTFDVRCNSSVGKSDPQSVTIQVYALPAPPTVQATPSAILTGGTSTLSTQGCTWDSHWSTVQNGKTIQVKPLVTTTYQVGCVTQQGCRGPDVPITVTVYPQNTKVTASPAQICAGDSSVLSATGCNGTINWSNGKTGATIKVAPIKSSDYKAYCLFNGTKDSITVSLTVYETVETIKLTVSTDSAIVSGSSIILQADGCKTGMIVWNIGTNGNKIQVFPTVTTTYSAYCLTINGCKSVVSSVTVKVKATNIKLLVSKKIICEGESVTLTAQGCPPSYLKWLNPIAQTNPTFSISPKAGTYKYEVQCDAPTGLVKDTATVVVKPFTKLQVMNTEICSGKKVDFLTLIKNYNQFAKVFIYPENSKIAITSTTDSPNKTTIYSIKGYNAQGCGDSTGIKVTVYGTPEKPLIRSNQKDTLVAGTPVVLRADNCKGNLDWQYFDEKGKVQLKRSATLSIIPSYSQNFKAICTSSDGCSSDTALYRIEVLQQIGTFFFPSVVCVGDLIKITNNCSTKAYWGDSLNYVANNTLEFAIPYNKDSILVDGKVILKKIQIRDSTFFVGKSYCFYQNISNTFKGVAQTIRLYVPGLQINDVFFYPNPSDGIISFGSTSCLYGLKIKIWDLVGRLMYDSNNYPDNRVATALQIDVSSYPAGEYLVEMYFPSGQKAVKRLLKSSK